MLIFGERHLRVVMTQYEACNGRRPHRSRQLRPPGPTTLSLTSPRNGSSASHVLGGLINEYGRAA